MDFSLVYWTTHVFLFVDDGAPDIEPLAYLIEAEFLFCATDLFPILDTEKATTSVDDVFWQCHSNS